MKFTNKYNLPEALVRAVQHLVNEPHNKPGEYSVTTLLLGPKEVHLTNRHFEEIEVDVSKEIWAVFGTAIHALLERNTRVEDGSISEYSLRYEVHSDEDPDKVIGAITGRCDLLTDSEKGPTIEDYKTTKAAAVKFADTLDKWREQLMGYCALLQFSEGIKVRRARNIALLKDWSEMAAKREADYPEAPVVTPEWEFTDEEIDEMWAKMVERARQLIAFDKLEDDMIPECTAEERWAKEPKWAIVKAGATKATKLCSTRAEAEELIRTKYGPTMYGIEERPGEDSKCLYYCKAKQFCDYYKSKYTVQLKSTEDK